MNRKKCVSCFGLVSIVAMGLLMTCGIARATSPLGPPAATFGKGRLVLGVDYTYSKMGIDLTGGTSSIGPMPGAPIDSFTVSTPTLTLGYGVCNWLDIEGRIGVSEGRWDESNNRFDGDHGLYIGGGVRATLYDGDRVDLGAGVQAHWFESDGENRGYEMGGPWRGHTEVEFLHLRIMAGANVEVTDQVSVYAGPFWQYIDGSKYYTEPGWFEDYDLDLQSDFGGLIGLQVRFLGNAICRLEGQFTDQDQAGAISLLWAFGPGAEE